MIKIEDGIKYFTTKDFSKFVNRSYSTIYGWIQKGYIKYKMIDGLKMIPESESENILKYENTYKWLTPKEACYLMNSNRDYLYDMIKQGYLKAEYIGGTVRIDRDEIERYKKRTFNRKVSFRRYAVGMKVPDREYFSQQEIANAFHVSGPAVFNWCESGKLNKVKVGNLSKVTRQSLVDFVEKSKKEYYEILEQNKRK